MHAIPKMWVDPDEKAEVLRHIFDRKKKTIGSQLLGYQAKTNIFQPFNIISLIL